MLKMHLQTKNEVSRSRHSKVRAWTDRRDRQYYNAALACSNNNFQKMCAQWIWSEQKTVVRPMYSVLVATCSRIQFARPIRVSLDVDQSVFVVSPLLSFSLPHGSRCLVATPQSIPRNSRRASNLQRQSAVANCVSLTAREQQSRHTARTPGRPH